MKNIYKRLDIIENKQEEMQKKQHGMKLNYLNRFTDVKDHTTEQINEVLAAVNKIKINCAVLNHNK